jgi:uncharacterized protein
MRPVAARNENVFHFSPMSDAEILEAPNILEYTYTRTTGPVIGRFMTSLRDGRIEGIRTSDGKVVVPPLEYDPTTYASLSPDDMVEVGPGGEVTTWTWVSEPRPMHPLDRPFAFALIKLDGSDSGLLHAVDAGDESSMRTGMRVTAQWRDERVGEMLDLACFVPQGEGA